MANVRLNVVHRGNAQQHTCTLENMKDAVSTIKAKRAMVQGAEVGMSMSQRDLLMTRELCKSLNIPLTLTPIGV